MYNPFETSELTFVGSYLPVQQKDYLRLLAMRDNETIQGQLQKIIAATMEEESMSDVTEQIIAQVVAGWKERPIQKNKPDNFGPFNIQELKKEYLQEVAKLLEKKKIPTVLANTIRTRAEKAINDEQ